MMYVGFLFLALAVAAVVVGFLQRKKLGTIISTPFKKTSEAGGAAGNVSCEGNVQAITPLTAPCSGRPCLYYEIEIKQMWEKQVRTEDGMKKKTGSRTAHTAKAGSTFNLDDGSGPVKVEAGDSIDGTFDKSFEGKGAGQGHLTYGQYQVQIGSPSEGHATGTKAVEKIIPAEGRLFVLGKVDNATIKKREGMLGNLMLSTKGRDVLMGATKRNMMIAFIAAGLMLPTGAGMAIFGDAPSGGSGNSCANFTDSIADACTGRIRGSGDIVMQWTVTEPGTYHFVTRGTGADETLRLWPSVTVQDSAGTPIFVANGTVQGIDQISGEIPAGTYTVRVNDVSGGHAASLEGGAGFSFDVDIDAASAGAEAPVEGALPAEGDAPAEGALPAEGEAPPPAE